MTQRRRLPFWVVMLVYFVLAFGLVFGAVMPWMEKEQRQNERERERARVECLDRGGSVQESEYGRYEGCVYGGQP